MDRDLLLQEIIASIQRQFELIFQKKYDELWQSYDQHLFRKNKAHMFEDKLGKRFMGIIKGVSQKGLLLVEDQEEVVTAYNFKEISYL